MAYARFGHGSDVYLYEETGGLICMRCQLRQEIETKTATRSAMIRHLEAHLEAGHSVPLDAIRRLQGEIRAEGDELGK